ncbi:WhiB family transcriptional regulator [Streptomyces cacaoi]
MSGYTGQVPDTLEPSGQWVLQAACAGANDAMFPDKNSLGNRHAKQVCNGCPVAMACLVEALRTGDNEFGVRGGLRPDERRKIARRLKGNYTDRQALDKAVQRVLYPATAGRSLRDVWEERTYPMPGGHLGFRGGTSVSFQGRSYAVNWVSWQLDRGRQPQGSVRRVCEVAGCVLPLHLADGTERRREAS